jgi:hypothetical protein
MIIFSKKIMASIKRINPNAKVMVHGDDVNDYTLDWLEGTTPISKAEIEAEISNAVKEIEDAKTKRIADKASADAKLKVLGLTDDEIEAFRS